MAEVLLAYTDTSDRQNELPRTLILDADETLLHSWENPQFVETYEIYTNPDIYRKFHPHNKDPIAYSMVLKLPRGESRIWGLYRPHLYEFLAFAADYFDNILVWSAGVKPYVEELIRQIFLDSGLQPPKLAWSRDRCPNYQGYYHKPISEIIADLERKHYTSFTVDPKSTLIVDDKLHTFMENPQNGILIPPYHPGKYRPGKIPTLEDLLDRSDRALLQLQDWLNQEEVKTAEDVRVLDKTSIFNSSTSYRDLSSLNTGTSYIDYPFSPR